MTDENEAEPDPLDPEARPRGIITKKDREFLLNKDEYSSEEQSDRRYRIRERVENAFGDFVFLRMMLSKDDTEKVFSNLLADEPTYLGRVTNCIEFIYSGVDILEYDFESLLENAIKTYEEMDNRETIPKVSVNIEITHLEPDVDEVVTRFIEGNGSIDDLNYLLRKRDTKGLQRLIDEVEDREKAIEFTSPQSDEGEGAIPPEVIQELAENNLDNSSSSEGT